MWKISDIDPDANYVLQLCQDEAGYRRLRLRDEACDAPHPEAIMETETVPHDILRQRNVFRIAKEVELKSGEGFGFDAHGIWFTNAELEALTRTHGDLNAVPWCSEKPPVLAPR